MSNTTQASVFKNMKVPATKVLRVRPRYVADKVVKRTKTKRADRTAVLGGRTVLTSLYTSVKVQMQARMTALEFGKLYTLSEMCGEESWTGLGSAWWRRQAGEAFAHMVSTGIFPFEFVQYKKYATKYYQLK